MKIEITIQTTCNFHSLNLADVFVDINTKQICMKIEEVAGYNAVNLKTGFLFNCALDTMVQNVTQSVYLTGAV